MSAQQRCFVGFELAPRSLEWLREATGQIHQQVAATTGWKLNPVLPENWHMTLIFFPGITKEERRQVWQAVSAWTSAGAWEKLDIQWEGWSLWPSPRRANLLCLEGAVYAPAARWPLQDCLEIPPFNSARTEHLARFRPHITLARFRRGGRPSSQEAWGRLQPQLPVLPASPLEFDRISLFISQLSAARPVYPREESMALPESLQGR